MTQQQLEKHFIDFTDKQKEILNKKSHDYATQDVLSNFKLSGNICQLSPEKQCLSLIATKIARLGTLLDAKQPQNEPITDSIIDLANYTFLLNAIISEQQHK